MELFWWLVLSFGFIDVTIDVSASECLAGWYQFRSVGLVFLPEQEPAADTLLVGCRRSGIGVLVVASAR